MTGAAPERPIAGKPVAMHISSRLAGDGKVDPKAYSPIARIGERNHVGLGDIVAV